jgi:hypothetical protein
MMGVGVVLVFVFWGLLPVSTPHPHDEYEYTNVVKIEPPVKPKEVIKKTAQVLARATLTIEELEKGKPEEKETPGKEAADQSGVSAGKKPDSSSEKVAQKEASTAAADHSNDDGHDHEDKKDDHSH